MSDFDDSTTSTSPSSPSETSPAPAAISSAFFAFASFAAFAAVKAGGGIGLPSASSCRNAHAGLVQFWYLHKSRLGPADSP